MLHADIVIAPADPGEIEGFLAYLEDHLADNGVHGNPLYQPQSRHDPWRRADRAPKMREAWGSAVGEPGWSRVWLARAVSTQQILGHADLRARNTPSTAHRALVGAGVHRGARRRGIASALMRHMLDWARTQPALHWLDLHVLGGNLPAQRLYLSLGFQQLVSVEDMFRIDGESVADIVMSLKLAAG